MNHITHGDHTIPARCRHVYYALSGIIGQTDYTRVHGKWRYYDLITVTGRSSSEKKLREMRDACPGLICEEDIPGSKPRGGDRPKRFWLSTASPLRSVERKPATTTQDGLLFDLPAASGE